MAITNMLRSGKELKVFTVKNGDLKKFTQEAKKYGVLYGEKQACKKQRAGTLIGGAAYERRTIPYRT